MRSLLYDVPSPVVIRRTRSYVKRFYPDADFSGRRISFRTPKILAVNYSLTGVYPDLLTRIESVMTDGAEGMTVRLAHGERALTLARYAPSHFLRGEGRLRSYETQLTGH